MQLPMNTGIEIAQPLARHYNYVSCLPHVPVMCEGGAPQLSATTQDLRLSIPVGKKGQ